MANKSKIMSVFLLFLLTAWSDGSEPQCSKFPYEEALLEKMVRMEIKVQEMEKGIRETQRNVVEELATLKNAANSRTKHCYFDARTGSTLTFTPNQLIPFDVVYENDGDCYSAKTGKFTAPVTGYYFFTTQLCGKKGLWFEFAFMVEGAVVQRSVLDGTGATPCWTSNLIRRLNNGDTVWLENKHQTNSLIQDDLRFNTFSGILLSGY